MGIILKSRSRLTRPKETNEGRVSRTILVQKCIQGGRGRERINFSLEWWLDRGHKYLKVP